MNFRVNMKARGDVFGEVSLMYNVPRTATVAATKASRVWVLERDLYRQAERRAHTPAQLPVWLPPSSLIEPKSPIAPTNHSHVDLLPDSRESA